jgi:AraC-like DNA-binding protein
MIEITNEFSFLSNNIIFRIAFPEYPVNLFVDHFVLMEGTPAGLDEKLFPNNKAEVFFNLGDDLKGRPHCSDQVFRLTESVLSGVRHTYFSFQPGKYLSMAGIRFTLFGFHHLFGVPAQHFTNQNFDATDVWGREMVERIREQLLETQDAAGRIRVLHNWMFAKIQGVSLQDMLKWKQVEDKLYFQQVPISSFLEKTIGYSHKHALQLIKEKSGLTPKTIQKVGRFNRALRLLNRSQGINWASLALDAGYADQSHFIREFRHFTGYTPAAYLNDKPRIYRLNEQLEISSKARG